MRKLVSIVFTDIVGYTRLMQRSEETALAIRSRHRSIIEEWHRQHGGKIIYYYGDSTLSTFESATGSVLCAIEMQKQF